MVNAKQSCYHNGFVVVFSCCSSNMPLVFFFSINVFPALSVELLYADESKIAESQAGVHAVPVIIFYH